MRALFPQFSLCWFSTFYLLLQEFTLPKKQNAMFPLRFHEKYYGESSVTQSWYEIHESSPLQPPDVVLEVPQILAQLILQLVNSFLFSPIVRKNMFVFQFYSIDLTRHVWNTFQFPIITYSLLQNALTIRATQNDEARTAYYFLFTFCQWRLAVLRQRQDVLSKIAKKNKTSFWWKLN